MLVFLLHRTYHLFFFHVSVYALTDLTIGYNKVQQYLHQPPFQPEENKHAFSAINTITGKWLTYRNTGAVLHFHTVKPGMGCCHIFPVNQETSEQILMPGPRQK